MPVDALAGTTIGLEPVSWDGAASLAQQPGSTSAINQHAARHVHRDCFIIVGEEHGVQALACPALHMHGDRLKPELHALVLRSCVLRSVRHSASTACRASMKK